MAEVVVVLTRPATTMGLGQRFSLETRAPDRLDSILATHGASFAPVFDLKSAFDSTTASVELGNALRERSELPRYLRTIVENDAAESLVGALRQEDSVGAAYIYPEVELPHAPCAMQTATPGAAHPPHDLRGLQAHMAKGKGFGLSDVWTVKGGRGEGVKIADVEQGWRLSHCEFRNAGIELICGRNSPDQSARNHGSAVLGVLGGKSVYIDGMAPAAKLFVASHEPEDIGPAKAIQRAAQALDAGDIMLLEMQQPGPRNLYQKRQDQRGYIAVEWFPHMFAAVAAAVARGVIVVEAAGNGEENLDDPIYNERPEMAEFGWGNPFAPGVDSGAIFVGAGAPSTPGHGVERSRLKFSNYGSRLDCQAWGEGVVTCGYGGFVAGSGEDEWYTDRFCGTSSAAAIIAGVLACAQGVARARGRPLTPARARDLLRTTGLAQQGENPERNRIGNRPDFAELLQEI